MNAVAFDPTKTYDVFTPVKSFTGVSHHEHFLSGHALVEGLSKSASPSELRGRETALLWFVDQGYRVELSKRPRED